MQYTKEIKNAINKLSSQGLSSRKIASQLGISKSGVNNVLSNSKTTEPNVKQGAKILLFDLETSAAEVLAFGRNKQFIGDDAILKEGGKILTMAWKWLGTDEILSIGNIDEIKEDSDLTNCCILWELFSEADAVIAHNANRFDVKVLNTRCLANGLPPLPTVKVIDTLVMSKKNFRFPTNRLNTLAQYLGVGAKMDTGGIELWKNVQGGSQEALDKMLDYNMQDVDILEKVYLKLRSFGHAGSSYNANHYNPDQATCSVCGSTNLYNTGRTITTAVSVFEEIRCEDCGATHRTRKPVNSKEQRSNIILPTSN